MTAIKREQFYVVYQRVVDTQALPGNGHGSTATLAASCSGRNTPDAFINFAEAQKDDCATDSAPV